MRGRAGRGRQANNRSTQSHIERRFNALERRLTGAKTVPAENPPAFVQLPWNSWTYERAVTTSAALETITVSVDNIREQIRGNVKLATDADIRIKVQSAQMWVTAPTLLYPDLEATFFELSGEKQAADQYARSIQRDKGTLNMPARCGYMFPSADRREILGASEVSLNVVAGRPTAEGSELTFRVQVLWCSSKSA